jgi:hypothetical protein
MSDPAPDTIFAGSHTPTPESVFDPEAQTRRERTREDPDAISEQICKSNPMAHSGARDESTTPSPCNTEICKSNPTAHSGARQFAALSSSSSSSSDARAQTEFHKTNPTAHSGARRLLSVRQFAALRLLARGHGSQRVADHLGVNRHTIARWKREPAFAAELERRVATLTESALRLRAGSRMHAFSIYRAELAERREK